MKYILLTGLFCTSLPLQAALIGSEDFNYPDGPIDGSFGGLGWDYVYATTNGGGTLSTWSNVFGGTNVSATFLITSESGVERNFNGNEPEGAVQATGAIFFRVEMTRGATTDWSGISFFDSAGTERLFFGTPYEAPPDTIREFGLTENVNGVASAIAYTGIDADDSMRTITGVIDFDNDLLGLWIDADASDFWDAAGGSANATLTYTASDWISSMRLASGLGSTYWDNLVIATTSGEVGLIPEPSSGLLAGIAGAGMLCVYRRRI